jgi:taurine dioxygenase
MISQPLEEEVVTAIEQAFVDHQVLLFRGDDLDARALVKFSRHFGTLRPHIQKAFHHPDTPEVVFNRNVNEDGSFNETGARRGVTEILREGWHSDLTYEKEPAKATIVHALEIPSTGGNTCFASAHRAYDDMPEALKRRVADLRVEFSLGRNSNPNTRIVSRQLTAADMAAEAVSHPVICRHPVSGRPAIFVNPVIATRILGVDEDESDDILGELFDRLDRPEYRWEHEWRVGDTLMWENRGGLMHTGRLDYPPSERRVMIRTTVGRSAIESYEPAA